ncbi:hypothetical protein VaNZ11_008169, partial [Volvox africanus]
SDVTMMKSSLRNAASKISEPVLMCRYHVQVIVVHSFTTNRFQCLLEGSPPDDPPTPQATAGQKPHSKQKHGNRLNLRSSSSFPSSSMAASLMSRHKAQGRILWPRLTDTWTSCDGRHGHQERRAAAPLSVICARAEWAAPRGCGLQSAAVGAPTHYALSIPEYRMTTQASNKAYRQMQQQYPQWKQQ